MISLKTLNNLSFQKLCLGKERVVLGLQWEVEWGASAMWSGGPVLAQAGGLYLCDWAVPAWPLSGKDAR